MTPLKIELVLRKDTTSGSKTSWAPSWGTEQIGLPSAGSPAPAVAEEKPSQRTSSSPEEPAASAPAAASTSASTPAQSHPIRTKQPKNWDKLEDSDDEDGKDVDHFFKALYATATPDQQRAMMKSFIESNGTSLSTDWSDVGKRKVDVVPPEGVEAKKW